MRITSCIIVWICERTCTSISNPSAHNTRRHVAPRLARCQEKCWVWWGQKISAIQMPSLRIWFFFRGLHGMCALVDGVARSAVARCLTALLVMLAHYVWSVGLGVLQCCIRWNPGRLLRIYQTDKLVHWETLLQLTQAGEIVPTFLTLWSSYLFNPGGLTRFCQPFGFTRFNRPGYLFKPTWISAMFRNPSFFSLMFFLTHICIYIYIHIFPNCLKAISFPDRS